MMLTSFELIGEESLSLDRDVIGGEFQLYSENTTTANDSIISIASSPRAVETVTLHGLHDPTVKLFRIVADVWLTIPIAGLGIIGNIVSFIVLCHNRKQRLRTITILLQALAVSDTLILISGLLMRSIRFLLDDHQSFQMFIQTIYYPTLATIYVLRLVNTWLTVLLTIDRYIAVCHPLQAQRLSAKLATNPKVQIFMVVILSFLFTLPKYFEYTIRYDDKDKKAHYDKNWFVGEPTYVIVYGIILFLLVQYLVPMILLVWLNGQVVWALRNSSVYHSKVVLRHHTKQQMSCNSSARSSVCSTAAKLSISSTTARQQLQLNQQLPDGVSKLQKATRNVTIMVVIVVLVCIICHVVAMIAQVAWSVELRFRNNVQLALFRRHISQATNLLITINSAGNFIVYCMCSRDFRLVIARWIQFCFCYCCCCSAPPRPARPGKRSGPSGLCLRKISRGRDMPVNLAMIDPQDQEWRPNGRQEGRHTGGAAAVFMAENLRGTSGTDTPAREWSQGSRASRGERVKQCSRPTTFTVLGRYNMRGQRGCCGSTESTSAATSSAANGVVKYD